MRFSLTVERVIEGIFQWMIELHSLQEKNQIPAAVAEETEINVNASAIINDFIATPLIRFFPLRNKCVFSLDCSNLNQHSTSGL